MRYHTAIPVHARGVAVTTLFSLLALVPALTGCAGSIFSHKPYHLASGKVVEASPKKVTTVWPIEERGWCGGTLSGGGGMCLGDSVYNVCPDAVPHVGTKFSRVDLSWDKPRKCWRWEAR
jgi:hypothetical protein